MDTRVLVDASRFRRLWISECYGFPNFGSDRLRTSEENMVLGETIRSLRIPGESLITKIYVFCFVYPSVSLVGL